MANLVVLKFDTPDGAEKGLELAVSLQKQQLLHIEDAAIITWPTGKKRPKTRQHPGVASAGALDGAFWGLLFGILFFMPVVGIAVGAAIGALGAHLGDYGIDDDFIKQVRTKVTEGTSALFLLLGAVTADKVVEAFKGAPHFELIASNLTHEQEEKLKEAFG
jgi:uncharacterized membrane protein